MTELSDAEVMAPPQELSDADVSAPPRAAPVMAGGGRPLLPLAAQVAPHVERVMEAFGHGFREGFGPDRLGLSEESVKWLSQKKIFGPAQGGYDNPLQAANELFYGTLAATADAVARGASGAFRGAQAAVFTGLGEGPFARDMAALPEAFFGSPHPLGTPKGLPPGAVFREVPAESRLKPPDAKAPVIEAYHGSPHDFERFDISKIGTGEGAQSYGHGLYFAERPEVARSYQIAFDAKVNGRPFDVNDPVHKAASLVEEFGSREEAISKAKAMASRDIGDFFPRVLSLLESDKELPKIESNASLYQVRINANADHFLDWDKPLSEQNKNVKDAINKLFPNGKTSWGFELKTGEDVVRALGSEMTGDRPITKDSPAASAALREAGIPGIKYFDQGSRGSVGDGTRNFVVFDDSAIEITHKNGEPVGSVPEPPSPIDQARDLGVIGPERPPISEGTPAEAAEREVPRASAAARTGDDVLRGPKETANGEPIDAWQARFEKWVDRVKVPDDVKEMIKDSAAENNNFPEARRGDIPLSHVEALADSAGIDPATISQTQRSAMGRLMRTDDEIRVAKQLFDQAAENFRTARDAAEADRTPENLIKVQEAIMRRDMALEQVIGLRAEWGRSGNALKDLLESVKSEQGLTDFLKDKGSSLDELNTIIDGTKGLDRTQTARVLSAMRDRKMGPVYWTWVQGLIAGIITHTKYVFANATYAELERGVTTPVAALIGAAKKLGGVEAERVFFGDVVAEHVGMIGAVPNAFMTAARSIKNGIRAPLDAETTLRQAMIDRGERVPISLERAAGMIPQERPISGVWGRIIGAPGDVAGGIHTFFKVLGLEAGKTTEAYRAAIKEGIDPRDDQFFERMNHHYLNPTEAALQRSVDDAYKGTFMQELGPRGKAFQRFIRDIPGLRWTFPFSHIPVNLVKAGYEYTPFAVLDGDMRAAIKGEKGGVAQDKAIARMVVGSAVMGWFTNLYLNGKATGDYPLDPKERDEWKLRRTMPNSILINGEWVSFERFGPVGTLMRNGANVGAVIQHLRAEDDDAMSKATVYAANAAARTIIDEVGFTMLNNLFEAYHDEKKGRALISSTAATLIPFSSLWRQTASAMDPDMRKAETLIDGIKMSIPGHGIPGVIGGRETLTPKRDWTGTPIHNPGYGGDLPLPGASAILRHAAVNMDPVDREMDALHIHPAPPQARIGGVALPSKLYDEYQSTAGPMTRVALEHMVNTPGWFEMPPFVREQAFRATIEAMRKAAGAMMQVRHPEIIQQGIDNRVNHINGEKKTKLKD